MYAKRICSRVEDFTLRSNQLKTHLLAHGYKEHLIHQQIQKAANTPHTKTLQPHPPRQPLQRTPLVVTFHPCLSSLPRIAKKYLPILHASCKLKKAIPNLPLSIIQMTTQSEKSACPHEQQICPHRPPQWMYAVLAEESLTRLCLNTGSTIDAKDCHTNRSHPNIIHLKLMDTSADLHASHHLTCTCFNAVCRQAVSLQLALIIN